MIPNYCASCGHRTESTLFCDDLGCSRGKARNKEALRDAIAQAVVDNRCNYGMVQQLFALQNNWLRHHPHDHCPELWARFEELTKPKSKPVVVRAQQATGQRLDCVLDLGTRPIWKSLVETETKPADVHLSGSGNTILDLNRCPAPGQVWKCGHNEWRLTKQIDGFWYGVCQHDPEYAQRITLQHGNSIDWSFVREFDGVVKVGQKWRRTWLKRYGGDEEMFTISKIEKHPSGRTGFWVDGAANRPEHWLVGNGSIEPSPSCVWQLVEDVP